jgi:hypothetical protein
VFSEKANTFRSLPGDTDSRYEENQKFGRVTVRHSPDAESALADEETGYQVTM